jgi:hypothetical protein
MKEYSGIHINVSDFDLPPLFRKFFTKRLEKLRTHSFFDSTISLQITRAGATYHGELKMNDLNLSLGCFDQSEDLLELFKALEREMAEKMTIWQLKEDYQHIYF